MPDKNARILTLVNLGFMPETAVAIVTAADSHPQPFTDDELASASYVVQADIVRAQAFTAFAALVPDRYRNLWGATSIT